MRKKQKEDKKIKFQALLKNQIQSDSDNENSEENPKI